MIEALNLYNKETHPRPHKSLRFAGDNINNGTKTEKLVLNTAVHNKKYKHTPAPSPLLKWVVVLPGVYFNIYYHYHQDLKIWDNFPKKSCFFTKTFLMSSSKEQMESQQTNKFKTTAK